ncbi:MAG: thioredoxin family protein [Armatimonadota bacterium]|nr:thioredoxin family protein [Armatimonadota bacterium]MDR7518231.1 thioredoxin family protein [Armatimonadota bacterium]MDR7548655.1 thioredoxin family protein [Armatimonadota bacterium]
MSAPVAALVIVLAAVGVVWLWLKWRRRRVMRARAQDVVETFGAAQAGALILSFSAPDCAPCKMIQRPALDALARQYPGRVVVRDVDALAYEALVERFGILTVPSTVVIGPDGGVRAINHGAATAERLAAQAGLNGQGSASHRMPA